MSFSFIWFLTGMTVIGWAFISVLQIHQLVEAKGSIYKSGLDKIALSGSWHEVTDEENSIMFKYYNSNFTKKFSEMSVEEFMIVELDNKSFFGRYAYVHPVYLLLSLILITALPEILFYSARMWIRWLRKE